MTNWENGPDWDSDDDPYVHYRCPMCNSEHIRFDAEVSFMHQSDYYYCVDCDNVSSAEDLVEPGESLTRINLKREESK